MARSADNGCGFTVVLNWTERNGLDGLTAREAEIVGSFRSRVCDHSQANLEATLSVAFHFSGLWESLS